MAGGSTELFNPAALFITFREAVEAVIILTVLFGFLDKSGQTHLKRSVVWGLVTGILAALSVGCAFIVIFYEAKQNLFTDDNEKLFEGIVMLVACFFITSLAFSMLRMFQMQQKWESRLAGAAETATATASDDKLAIEEASSESAVKKIADPRWTFFLLAFTSVFREGVETFVFMAGVAQADPRSLPIPGIIGVVIGIICGFFLFRGAKPANLAIFFYASTFMLFLIAAGLLSRGVHEFQELGEFGVYWEDEIVSSGGRRHLLAAAAIEPATGLDGESVVDKMGEGAATSDFFQPAPEVPAVSWANTPLADWRDCCDQDTEEFYVLLRAIFGYSSVPTRLEVVTYCGYWLAALLVLSYKLKKGTLWGKQHLPKGAKGATTASEVVAGGGVSGVKLVPAAESPSGPDKASSSDGDTASSRTSEEAPDEVKEAAALVAPAAAAPAAAAAAAARVAPSGMPLMVVVDPLARPEDDPPAAPQPKAFPASAPPSLAARARAVLSRPDVVRLLGEAWLALSVAALVVGLLCASLLPGLDLREMEMHDGLPGSAPYPNLGVTRKFTLVLEEVELLLADGTTRLKTIAVNGTVPGPELRVQHGNWVEVQVINKMAKPTTVHWHGIPHRSSPFSDGVIGFTQCALPARVDGQEYPSVIYRFEAYLEGTFWYHGHLDSQYVDGLFGPLVVEGIPEQFGGMYNAEWTWMAADFHRKGAESIVTEDFLTPLNPDGYEPIPDAIWVNGKFSGDLRYSARRGDKVRVRFVNSAAWSPWNVSVDGLPLTVIEVDGQDVKPVSAPWVVVNVAQRVSFVIDTGKVQGAALRNSDQLYFRVQALNDTYPLGFEGNYANQGYKKLNPLFLGVIDFAASEPTVKPRLPSYGPADVPAPRLSGDALPDDDLAGDLISAQPSPEAPVGKPTHRLVFQLTMDVVKGVNRGFLNGVSHSGFNRIPTLMQLVDFGDAYINVPALKDVWSADASTDAAAMQLWDITPDANGRYVIPFLAEVQMVIFNTDGGPHPFHLHGHKLSLIASSANPGNEFTNGPNYLQRDVVTLPAASDDGTPGWVKVQFLADNPGVWPLHCHIDWHMAAGLMAEILEAPDQLSLLGGDAVPKSHLKLCGIERNLTKSG